MDRLGACKENFFQFQAIKFLEAPFWTEFVEAHSSSERGSTPCSLQIFSYLLRASGVVMNILLSFSWKPDTIVIVYEIMDNYLREDIKITHENNP